jgi:uncharacterized protein YcaQ
VEGYQPEFLDNLMYSERQFFEYGGALFIYPMDELPYWRRRMSRHRVEKRWADFAEANPHLLEEVRQTVRQRGPLRSRDLEGKAVNSYRAGKDSGIALYYLWLTGELMTHSRQNGERVYDFLENVAQPDLQWIASPEDTLRYFLNKTVSLHGLIGAREFRAALQSLLERPIDMKEAQVKLAELVAAGELGATSIAGSKGAHYYLLADQPILHDLAAGMTPTAWQPVARTTEEEVTLLSPLDYVSARGRAADLFDFDYIWEIYKPADKRKYGPYTLPVLYGDRLVARLDAKLDRKRQTLVTNGFWLESGFTPDQKFGSALEAGLLSFARFLGADQIIVSAITENTGLKLAQR